MWPTYSPISDLKIERRHVEKLQQKINISKAVSPTFPTKYWTLKECAAEPAEGLTCIFQCSVNTSLLPKDWRRANDNVNVTPVFNTGDKHLAENYWPVSLTSVSSKLPEHIVFSHLMSHLNHHKILSNLNHGFHSGFSCETQLITTLHNFGKSSDQNIQADIAIYWTLPKLSTLSLIKNS